MIVLYMKLKLLDMQTNVNGIREKMTGMSVFRDEKAVKSSPKSEKSLKTQRNWRLSRTFLLSLHFESSAPACRWHSLLGGARGKSGQRRASHFRK